MLQSANVNRYWNTAIFVLFPDQLATIMQHYLKGPDCCVFSGLSLGFIALNGRKQDGSPLVKADRAQIHVSQKCFFWEICLRELIAKVSVNKMWNWVRSISSGIMGTHLSLSSWFSGFCSVWEMYGSCTWT